MKKNSHLYICSLKVEVNKLEYGNICAIVHYKLCPSLKFKIEHKFFAEKVPTFIFHFIHKEKYNSGLNEGWVKCLITNIHLM